MLEIKISGGWVPRLRPLIYRRGATPEGRSSVRGYGLRMTVRVDPHLVMLDISRCFVHGGVGLFPLPVRSAQVIA